VAVLTEIGLFLLWSCFDWQPMYMVCYRFQPSQADAVVFKALSGAPAAEFVNALRWYNQINSYGKDKDR